MMQTFTDIDGSTLKRKLEKQDADLVAAPKKYTRKLEVDERIRAIEVDGETVPYLACNLCQTIFTWFKFDSDKKTRVNQSGIKTLKNLAYSCTKLEKSIGMQSRDIKKIIQAQ